MFVLGRDIGQRVTHISCLGYSLETTRFRKLILGRNTFWGVTTSWCVNLTCDKELPWGQKKMASISPFQHHPIIPRTFL